MALTGSEASSFAQIRKGGNIEDAGIKDVADSNSSSSLEFDFT